MNKRTFLMVAAIPLASVIMGAVLLYFAATTDDTLPLEDAPLSKTSWKAEP
jgi:hypothetical protein